MPLVRLQLVVVVTLEHKGTMNGTPMSPVPVLTLCKGAGN